jgi:hypothetical protein
MDIVFAVVRKIIILQSSVRTKTSRNSESTDDHVAYVLDVFHQEANVELGI